MQTINENSDELNETFTKRVEREEAIKKDKKKKLIGESTKTFLDHKDEFKHKYVSSAIMNQTENTLGTTSIE